MILDNFLFFLLISLRKVSLLSEEEEQERGRMRKPPDYYSEFIKIFKELNADDQHEPSWIY